MSLFTSNRERNLWLWALATMVAIYSTLGPARTLVDALRERNLLRLSFAVLVLVLVGALAWKWARKRSGWREIGVALGVGFAYLMTFIRMGNPEERTHLIEYGVVAALLHQGLLERQRNGYSVPGPAALAVVVTAVLGTIDELIQAVLPNRVFDVRDIGFNALAGFMVIVARLAIAPVERPSWRLWFLWILAAAFGWGITMDAGTFGEPYRIKLLQSIPPILWPRFASVAAGAILVGFFQWLILRRYIADASKWLLASIAGAALSGAVVFGGGSVSADAGLVAGIVLYGTIVGMLQWLILRRHVASAGWWVLASTLGVIAAIPLGSMMGPPGWAIYGAITGTAIVWLLRQDPPSGVAQS